MISKITLLLLLFIEGSIFLTTFSKYWKISLFLFLNLFFMYDIINIKGDFIIQLLDIKLVLLTWKEVFFLELITIYIIQKTIKDNFRFSKGELIFWLSIAFFSIYGLTLGISNGIVPVIKSWRSYLFPFVFFYLIAYFLDVKKDSFFKFINYLIIFFGTVMAIYSIYSFLIFSGNLNDIWDYKFVLDAKMKAGLIDARFVDYQFLRNGNLRASGFFVSALEYAMFMPIPTLLSFGYFKFNKNIKKIFFAIITVINFFGIYVAQVRAGILLVFMGIILMFLIDKFKPSLRYLLFSQFLLIMVTFLSMIFGDYVHDASALGRILQYVMAFMNFKVIGYGLGSKFVTTMFDSWYISIFMLFGVVGVFFLYAHIHILKKIYNYKFEFNNNHHLFISWITISSYFVMVFYLFSIHFSVGSHQLYILYLYVFLLLKRSGYLYDY